MNKIKYYLIILTGLIAACTDMDDSYNEFTKDGPIVYLGNVENIEGYAGRERIAIAWSNINDPRAEFAEVSWNGGKSMETYDVKYGEGDTLYISDLSASKYAFNIRLGSSKGFYSLKNEVLLQVYDSVYESYLVNREIKEETLEGNELKLVFPEATSDIVETQFSYADLDGVVRNVIVSSDKKSCTLENLEEGTAIAMQTLYKPVENCIDTFYSPKENIYVGGDKLQIFVGSAAASEYQDSRYTIGKTIDGKFSSFYHSRYGDRTQMPVTLEYFFEDMPRLDIIEYTPRDNSTYGSGGNFKEFELWAISGNDTDYVKIGDYDFKGSGDMSTIYLDEGLVNPKAVKFIVKTANLKSNGLPAVACAEMQFFRRPQWWLDLN